jgi:hypothetical protein
MNTECRIEGVRDQALAAAIAERARAWLATRRDYQQVVVRPADAPGHWNVLLRGPHGCHVASMAIPTEQLLVQFDAHLHAGAAEAERQFRSRLLEAYANALTSTNRHVRDGLFDPGVIAADRDAAIDAAPSAAALSDQSEGPISSCLTGGAVTPDTIECSPLRADASDRSRRTWVRRRPSRRMLATWLGSAALVMGWYAWASMRHSALPAVVVVPAASGWVSPTVAEAPRLAQPKAPLIGTPADTDAAKPGLSESGADRTSLGVQWLSPGVTRLGIQPGWRASAIGMQDARLMRDLQQCLGELWLNRVAANNDVILFEVRDELDLARFAALKAALKHKGVLWTFWRRGSPITASQIVASARAADMAPARTLTFSSTHNAAAFRTSSHQR